MTLEDIHATLVHLNMITVNDTVAPPRPLPGQSIKFPKGRKNGIARKHLQRTQTQDDEKAKGPFVPPVSYEVRWNPKDVEEYLARWEAKNYFKLQPEKLKWSPFISARTRKSEQFVPEAVGVSEDAGPKSSVASGGEQSWTPEPTSGWEAEIPPPLSRAPVSALFDDNVEIVTPANNNPAPSASEPSVAQSTSSGSSWDADQLEKDRILAERLATMPERRLRSRGLSNDTSSATGALLDDRPSLTERRRSSRQPLSMSPLTYRAPRGNGRFTTTSVQEDEDHKKRQLRARSNGSQEIKRNIGSPASSRSVSPRKRRRVDSSPEVAPAVLPSPSPVRRSLRHTENHNHPVETSVESRQQQQRRSTRTTNGNKPVFSKSIMAPPTLNGHIKSSDSRRDVEEQLFEGLEEDDLENGIVHSPADEMKYEDTGTPATLMNSRHSAPSDDTVFNADGGGAVLSKGTPPARRTDSEIQSVAAQKQPTGVVHAQQPSLSSLPVTASMGYEELGDEDAEGEDDIDAEGEPDDEEEQLVLASVSMNTIEGSTRNGQIFAV